jgi:hypothetical protein
MSLGEKLQIASLGCLVGAGVLGIVGALLGFVGTQLSDKSYWSAITGLRTDVAKARTRKQPEWTPFVRVKSQYIPSGLVPLRVRLQFQLHSDDTTVPLMVRVAADVKSSLMSTGGPSLSTCVRQ